MTRVASAPKRYGTTTLRAPGGGINQKFGVPTFQRAVKLPAAENGGHAGRGSPDVAAAAGAAPGYRVVMNGKEVMGNGTSASTPLWAALVALANKERGWPIALVHDHLYQHPELFRDIIHGNNRAANGIGYDASAGWDACTGLGTPLAGEVVRSLSTLT